MNCQLINVITGQPFVASCTLVQNTDGSTSFQLPDGNFVGQTPNQYGVQWTPSAENKQYQRSTVSGNTATFLTRDGDIPCCYLLVIGKVYPS
jgi:hypothetical protein